MKSAELSKRLITAGILIPVVLAATLWSNTIPFAVGIYFIILLGAGEVIQLSLKSGEHISRVTVWAGALFIPLCFQFDEGWILFAFLLTALVFLAFLFKLFSSSPTENVMRFVSANIFTALFFPFLMSFLWLVRMLPEGGRWLIFLFVVIWVSDSAAYFAGSLFGKHHIVPKVSPKKSLEGFIAGLFFGVLAGVLYYKFFLAGRMDFALWQIIMLACDVAVAGILGDLFESMLKRSAGVKDSGNIFPGHGGVLDRVDSLMFAAPVLYIYLRIFIRLSGNE